MVFRTGQLGDSIVCLPALHEIRRKHPDSPLFLLTDDQEAPGFVLSSEVFSHTGYFSGQFSYNPRRMGATGLMKLAVALRRMRFERLYYLTSWRTRRQVVRDWLFFRVIVGIDNIRGFRDSIPRLRDASGALLRLENEAQRLGGIVGASKEAIVPPTFRPAAPARDVARQLVADELKISEDTLRIALCPGSKMPSKRWPLDRYKTVVTRILRRFPQTHVLVIGGPEDAGLGREVCEVNPDRCHNLAGRLSIQQSAALLERCHLYVGNDTGAMHLAAAVEVPCVAVFSARENPGIWEPLGRGHTILRRNVPCAGCMLAECTQEGHPCITMITEDEVFSAVSAALEREPTLPRKRAVPSA